MWFKVASYLTSNDGHQKCSEEVVSFTLPSTHIFFHMGSTAKAMRECVHGSVSSVVSDSLPSGFFQWLVKAHLLHGLLLLEGVSAPE